MDNIIVIAVVALIVGAAVWYIQKEKRRGIHCVGCPDSKTCSGGCAAADAAVMPPTKLNLIPHLSYKYPIAKAAL